MELRELREELKPYLTGYVESITTKSKGKKKYVCPLCGSGSGSSKTGAFSITKEGDRWMCFSCQEYGDILDLIGKYEGITDNVEQIKRACDITGVPFPEYQKQYKSEQYTHTHNSIHIKPYTPEPTQEMQETDFTDFFLQAHKDIDKTNYHRGLSRETLERFNIGYVESWRHPKATEKVQPTPRLIIPITKYNYTARDTRTEIPAEQEDYKKSKAKGKEQVCWIFNREALKESRKPVFIVEGEIDAMSIEDVGGRAVALGSITNVKSFLQVAEEDKPTQALIICLDNDTKQSSRDNVEKAVQTLERGLTELGINHYRADITGQSKDANEAMNTDRETFTKAVQEAQLSPEQAEKRAYIESNCTASYIQSFVDGITDSVNTPFIPTGFKRLDEILDGGLYEGLYLIGAVSSLGKTTLVLQIADQIAKSGKDVLIFSLEMGRTELMAKSISRETIELSVMKHIDSRLAKTTRGITTGSRWQNYSTEEVYLIDDAIQEYQSYADHIYIKEGVGDIGVKEIREAIKEHITLTGNTPVVFIDYMQMIAPADVKATDKQNTDKAVLELKRMSRDFKLPVVGVSSFNRGNYKTEANYSSFKESGSLEYTADMLMGLQFEDVGTSDFDENEARKASPRHIEAVILKNRNGASGDKIYFNYYPMFNYYSEDRPKNEADKRKYERA